MNYRSTFPHTALTEVFTFFLFISKISLLIIAVYVANIFSILSFANFCLKIYQFLHLIVNVSGIYLGAIKESNLFSPQMIQFPSIIY